VAHLQVTIDTDKLKDLFAFDEGMAALAEQILNQVLDAQMTEHLQAKPYERTERRRAYRNGYKPRQLTTRVGTLTLREPDHSRPICSVATSAPNRSSFLR
jgi:transposase-like protein